MTVTRRMLLLDDAEAVRMTLASLLEDFGFVVIEAGCVAEARAALADGAYDIVVVDLHLPDGLGIELLDEVRARHPDAPLVVLSGSAGEDSTAGADLVLAKGGDPVVIAGQLEEAIARRRARR